MAEEKRTEKEPILIKKYANRRLYNTATSNYVTLDHLCQMVKEGSDFTVFDAKTGEDITRAVLTQIIFEEENKGQNMLPIKFLRQIIQFYGDSLQGVLPNYLELSMEAFSRNQDQMRTYLNEAFGDMSPFRQFEEMGRQNMAMFQKTMSMFNPLTQTMTGKPGGKSNPSSIDKDEGNGELGELRSKLDELQRQLNELAESKK